MYKREVCVTYIYRGRCRDVGLNAISGAILMIYQLMEYIYCNK